MNKEYLERITSNGRWEGVNLLQITPEMVSKLTYGETYNLATLVGLAAQNQTLDRFPKTLFNPQSLICGNNVGETALHFAALKKQLCHIPRELLTQVNLCAKNRDGSNPMHFAALTLTLKDIPEKLLTQKNLLTENNQGLNVLDYSLLNSTLTVKDIKMGKDSEKYPLMQQVNRQVRYILYKLDDQAIENYLSKEKLSQIEVWKTELIKPELNRRMISKALFKKNQSLEI